MAAESLRRKSKQVRHTDWFPILRSKPPATFPHPIVYEGEQIGYFLDVDEYQNGIVHGLAKLTEKMRLSIFQAATKEAALVELFRKIDADDFFKRYRHAAQLRNIRADRMRERRAREKEEQAAKRRAQRERTFERMQHDVDTLSVKVSEYLMDADLPSNELYELAKLAGSIHTRFRQLAFGARRREGKANEEGF